MMYPDPGLILQLPFACATPHRPGSSLIRWVRLRVAENPLQPEALMEGRTFLRGITANTRTIDPWACEV